MERSTLLGIAAVAVLGVVLAGLAGWTMSTPTRSVTPPVIATPDVAARQAAQPPADVPPEAAPPEPAAGDQDAPPADRPPPRTASSAPLPRGAAELDTLLLRSEQFTQRPLFSDLSPDASPAEVVEYLGAVVDDAEAMVQEYRAVSREANDVGVAGEALHRAAMLYDHVAAEVPPVMPGNASDEQVVRWESQREEMVQSLRRQAEALREDATTLHNEPR